MNRAMAILAGLIGNYCRNRQRLPRSFEVVCVKRDSPGDCEESQHKVCQDEGRDERVGDERLQGFIVVSLYSDTCHILYGNNTISESLLFALCPLLYTATPLFSGDAMQASAHNMTTPQDSLHFPAIA